MNPYAIISVTGDQARWWSHTTKVAIEGGCNPVWDCAMEFRFEPPHNNYTVSFDIKHSGKLIDRDIGVAGVSLKDVFAGDVKGEKVRYPVKIKSGEEKGEIILSYKLTKVKILECKNTNTSTGGNKVDKITKDTLKSVARNKVEKTKMKKKGTLKPVVAKKVEKTKMMTDTLKQVAANVVGIKEAFEQGVSLVEDLFGPVVGRDEDGDEDEDEDEEDEYEDEDEDKDEDDDDDDDDDDEDEEDEDEDEDDDDEDEEDEDEFEVDDEEDEDEVDDDEDEEVEVDEEDDEDEDDDDDDEDDDNYYE